MHIPADTSPAPTRVWGDPAWDIGRYWSEAPPQTVDQFYGGLAVQYDWNGGLYLATLQAVQTGVTSIKVWKGPTARQPADLLDPSGSGRVVGTLKNYVLPGGEIQYFVPDGTFPYFTNQKTAWNAKLSQATQPAPIQIPPLAAPLLPPDMEPGTYEKLLASLGRLATLLQQIEAGNNRPLLGAKEGFLNRSAERLVQSAKRLNKHLLSASTNPDAKDQVNLTLWSLVATGRHVDGDLSFSGQQDAVNQAITDVVTAAYRLAKATTPQVP
ncbi:MAG: hypothetical protein VKN56_05115 [Cyanobacteriota bacterium]|nr:hypothetical protein [Cyanobacteriota bacterium]